jgi:hypothetical protein
MAGVVEVITSSYVDDSAIASFFAVLESYRPKWQQAAACRGKGPDPWFPGGTQGRTTERLVSEQEAVELCERCPVRVECAEAGMREKWGVWGGVLRDRATTRRKVA